MGDAELAAEAEFLGLIPDGGGRGLVVRHDADCGRFGRRGKQAGVKTIACRKRTQGAQGESRQPFAAKEHENTKRREVSQ